MKIKKLIYIIIITVAVLGMIVMRLRDVINLEGVFDFFCFIY